MITPAVVVGFLLIFVARHEQGRRCFDYTVEVDDSQRFGPLPPFWESTGLCPPDPHQEAQKFMLSEDMEQNLHFIGAIPIRGPGMQVRIHWLMDLVSWSSSTNGYNFTFLDQLMEWLHRKGLRPGFELMGNPSGIFHNFDQERQVHRWKELVTLTAKRYIERYGIDEVSQWNFETWNEPDHHDFDDLNITLTGFLKYYDACSEGLAAASSDGLKLGGPGGSCHLATEASPMCWALLEHCSSTKRRLDFISFHKKGMGSALKILQEEIQTIARIHQLHPELQATEIFNDEADPMVGWSRPIWWRSDATYAAMASKVLVQHIEHYFGKNSNTNFGLLSNDNAFLSYHPHHFNQRTLLARFQMNLTHPPHVQFVRKPIYAAQALWSKLGPILLPVQVSGSCSSRDDHVFGAVATMDWNQQPNKITQVTVLLYNSADSKKISCTSQVLLIISNMTVDDPMAVMYVVDNQRTNPAEVWRLAGKPPFPNRELLRTMRRAEGPYCLMGPANPLKDQNWRFELDLQLPGVALLHVCGRGQPPKKVTGVRFVPITKETLLIGWNPSSNECILTYEVEYSQEATINFTRISHGRDAFLSTFQFDCSDIGESGNCTVHGFYRVRAVDYWRQKGPYSKAIKWTIK